MKVVRAIVFNLTKNRFPFFPSFSEINQAVSLLNSAFNTSSYSSEQPHQTKMKQQHSKFMKIKSINHHFILWSNKFANAKKERDFVSFRRFFSIFFRNNLGSQQCSECSQRVYGLLILNVTKLCHSLLEFVLSIKFYAAFEIKLNIFVLMYFGLYCLNVVYLLFTFSTRKPTDIKKRRTFQFHASTSLLLSKTINHFRCEYTHNNSRKRENANESKN